jgi:hypothetical protein
MASHRRSQIDLKYLDAMPDYFSPRNKQIVMLIKNGTTFKTTANHFGLSVARIRQILSHYLEIQDSIQDSIENTIQRFRK